ncbi:ATP-binding protein [Salipaludibacillus sp. CUR1]|uniref:sensor histidine kinase n=1 Tax=Salipaludibacillus sp. CUR1 TaxID=2820003 RepID=UPI001E51098D|nr:PAS domain-containing sensor histidine kinase [Salipaludibacillus sp. CUR1]MCE7791593.1 ATP-binding protein [Salipaludibacillus sp. CUR1]
MKNLFPKGLTGRFFFLGLFLILLPVTLVFIVAVTVSQAYLTERTHNQTNQEALYMAIQTNQMVEDKINRMESAVYHYRDTGNAEAFQALVNELHLSDPFYRGSNILDAQGNVEFSSQGTNVSPALQTVLSNVAEKMEWRRSSFIFTNSSQEPLGLYMAVPIQNEDHSPIEGVIVSKISSTYLHNFFRTFADEAGTRALLADSQGNVYMDSSYRETGESIAGENFYRDIKRERTEVIDTSWRENEVLIAHHAVDRHPLYTVIITDKDYAYASTERLTEVLALGWMILFTSGIAMIIITRRKMVVPIKKLTKQSYDYAEGEAWKINLLSEKNEIKTLSKSMHHMAEDLKAKERYLKLILESFPYGVLTIDEEGIVTSLNKVGEQLIEHSKKQFVGKSYRRLPSKKLVKLFDRHLKKSRLTETVTDEIKYVDQTGKTKHMKLTISPLRNEDNQLIGQLVTLWDYTTIKELEGHLQRSEHLAAIGQMTAGLAHEVKNPLGTVQMAAEVIHEEVKEIFLNNPRDTGRFSMILEAAGDIQDETKRLDNLVKKFLQVSKNKKSEEKLLKLKEVNDKVLHLLAHQFRYYDIDLYSGRFPEKDLVLGDESQLIQAFMNVYLNAVEAMQEQGGNLRVAVKKQHNDLILTISDTGEGIEPSKINRIFHPFFSNKQEGTGLGLSITHDIIKEHGGRIDVESEAGLGTTFKLYLPEAKERSPHNE